MVSEIREHDARPARPRALRSPDRIPGGLVHGMSPQMIRLLKSLASGAAEGVPAGVRTADGRVHKRGTVAALRRRALMLRIASRKRQPIKLNDRGRFLAAALLAFEAASLAQLEE